MKRNVGVALVLVMLAAVVGGLSIASDGVPLDLTTRGVAVIAFYVVAVLANDIVVWFVLSMAIGRLFGRSWWSGAIIGAGFALLAISVYLIGSRVSSGQEADLRSTSIWLAAAFVGGALGGAVGWSCVRIPVLLVLPAGLAVFRIVSIGSEGRSSLLGGCVLAVCAAVVLGSCVAAVWLVRRRRAAKPEGSADSALPS